MQFHCHSSSADGTADYAAHIVNEFRGMLLFTPLVLALHGEMGSGKTQFAKGVGQALGVKKVVSSPSYVLVKEYLGEHGKLIHIDCWRTPEITPEELSLESYLNAGTVVVIEWPKPLLGYLRDRGNEITLIELEIAGEDDKREIKEIG
jgi:tRNA threonylcarbamoyladenosine biosynthesis protein TsaE